MPWGVCGNGVMRAGNRDRLPNVPFFKLLDPNLDSQPIERCLLTGQSFFAGRAFGYETAMRLIVTQ